MTDKIVLRSTSKGFVSCYFWSAVWVLVFLTVGLWLSSYIDSIYQAAHVSSLAEFDRLGYSQMEKYSEPMDPAFIIVGKYVSYVIAAVVDLVGFLGPFYGAREINTFTNNKAGRLGKVVCETYGFPFSKSALEIDGRPSSRPRCRTTKACSCSCRETEPTKRNRAGAGD